MAYRDSYGSEFSGPRLTLWVRRLLIGLTAAFLVLFVTDDLLRKGWTEYLVFAPAAILRQPWSVLTFPLVERNPLSLLFVLITVFFFAGPLEEKWGARGFLQFLGVSAFGGVIGALLLATISPSGMAGMPLSGFTGAIYGMLLAFALYWPEMEIRIWGIIPVKAKWLALVSAAVGFILSVQAGGRGLAHLGAFVTAYAFLKSPWAPREWGEVVVPRKAARKQQTRAVVPWAGKREQAAGQPAPRPPAAAGARRSGRAERDLLDDVDRILDKISAEGLSSLTDDERKRLDEVSRRYRTN